VSEADREFVRDAAERWSKLLDYAEGKDASTAAMAISLWATMNVDRLLTIAARTA
jgi:hypothetical protein